MTTDENGVCSLGLYDPIGLDIFHEGREACDTSTFNTLHVKFQEGESADDLLIYFSSDGGATYYPNGEPRIASRVNTTMYGSNRRLQVSEEEMRTLHDRLRRKLQCPSSG